MYIDIIVHTHTHIHTHSPTQGKCQRKDPPCKYLHPPVHLREQLLQNGRTNLILRNMSQFNHPIQHYPINPMVSVITPNPLCVFSFLSPVSALHKLLSYIHIYLTPTHIHAHIHMHI